MRFNFFTYISFSLGGKKRETIGFLGFSLSFSPWKPFRRGAFEKSYCLG
jgi:hypothetical protein